ncbi:MAG: Uncharacterised protein [Formosa sp. Hel1_33_131]|nr:MAG: Uncharacterised protein [Formosa sp. Hel1_33_131]
MKSVNKFVLLLFITSISLSCFEDTDDNPISSIDIKDFVWKGLNFAYLYKDDVDDLANDRFGSDGDYQNYLNSFENPERLFENLIFKPDSVDRFSWITDDYIALEQQFSGVSKTSGAEFNFYYIPGSSSEVLGIVRLIHPNSNASQTVLERGQIFTSIDGQSMTESNLGALLSNDTFSIGLATYEDNGTTITTDDQVISTDEMVMLTKTVYNENPIFKNQLITLQDKTIGYLMYNGFVSDYDAQLNDVFGEFKGQNIQYLILDLRYNPGGSVNTATELGSMITGIDNEVFAILQYNSDLESNNSTYDFTNTLSENEAAINSLGLTTLYVLTSDRSASASEMIINSLRSYIEVIQIGTKTVGKSQASVTIYDSPTFQKKDVNPSHSYAMQPLVAITVNKNNEAVPPAGLIPQIEIAEGISNYGVLGDISEPLLAAAISEILGSGRRSINEPNLIKPISDSDSFIAHSEEMYID